MSEQRGADSLSTTRHVMLILRLVLAPGERQLQGDLVDPETGWSRRFVGVEGLSEAVDGWAKSARDVAGTMGPMRPNGTSTKPGSGP